MMSAAMATHRNDSNDETHLLSVRKAAEFLSVSDVTIRGLSDPQEAPSI